jgi:ubiquinone/menaquinone biosynthesis C-methylase UbiE
MLDQGMSSMGGTIRMNPLRAFFEDLAERWDAQQPVDRLEVLGQLLASFDTMLGAAQVILEVGTGTGALIPCLKERAPAARLVSIDLAYAMLRRARQRGMGALLVQADAHQLPFASDGPPGFGFDLVVCHNSFPHFANKPAALLDLARVLRPGGRLLILHDLSREKVNAIHSGAGEAVRNDLLPPGIETEHMLVRAGFIPLQVQDTEEHYVVVGRRA